MSRIFWDTNLFIYLFEGTGAEAERVAALRGRMRERGDHLLTSALTLGELQVKPQQKGRPDLCELYERTLRENAEIVAFDTAATRVFAAIRANQKRSIRTADAIQLACAAVAGTDLFLSNDRQLRDLQVPGIHFFASPETVPF